MSRTKDLLIDQMENEYNVYCKKREMNDMNRLNDDIQNFIQKYIKNIANKDLNEYVMGNILCFMNQFNNDNFKKWFRKSEYNNKYSYRIVSSFEFDIDIVKDHFISFNMLLDFLINKYGKFIAAEYREDFSNIFATVGIVVYPKEMKFHDYLQKEFGYVYREESPDLMIADCRLSKYN